MGGGTSRPAPPVQTNAQIIVPVQISQENSQNVRQTPNLRVQTTPTSHSPGSAGPDSYIGKVDFHLPEEDVVTPRREVNMRASVPFTPIGAQALSFPYYCPLCMEHFKDILVSPCCGNYACMQCSMDYLATQTQSFAPDVEIAQTNLSSGNINDLLGLVRAHEQAASRKGPNVHSPLQCPHCRQAGYCPSKVALSGRVRNYATTPCPVKQQQGRQGPGPSPACSSLDPGDGVGDMAPGSGSCCSKGARPSPDFAADPTDSEETSAARGQVPSPVRVGDSFDSLKRKMLQFQLLPGQGQGTHVQARDSTLGAVPLSPGPACAVHASASASASAGASSSHGPAATSTDAGAAGGQLALASPLPSGAAPDWIRRRSSNQDSPDNVDASLDLKQEYVDEGGVQAEAGAGTEECGREDFASTLGLLFASGEAIPEEIGAGVCVLPIAASE